MTLTLSGGNAGLVLQGGGGAGVVGSPTAVARKTYNAADFPGATPEARINAMLARCTADVALVGYVPLAMAPYNASLITGLAAFHALGGRLVLEGDNPGQYNAKAYGAAANNVADDATAMNNAYLGALTTKGVVFLPTGIYRYSFKPFPITNKVAICGAGKRQTFLCPLTTYTDYAITITNCWRNGAESAHLGSMTLDTTLSTAGVSLRNFTIYGDLNFTARGIATVGTVDFLHMQDIDLVTLNGTALQLGVQSDAFHTSCVRESFFKNVTIELSGNLSEPALDLGGGADGASGDGTNDLTFISLNLANNKGVAWRMQQLAIGPSIRGINVYGLIVNGDGPEAPSPTPADLIQITGLVAGINIDGLFLSGTATVAGTPYAGIRLGSNATGRPDRIKIHGDIVSLLGDGYVIDSASGVQIGGTSGVSGAGVTELKVAAGQPGSFNLQYDVISQQSVLARQSLISIGDEAAAFAIYGSFRDGTPMAAVDADTTPDVRNVSVLLLSNTNPQQITDFDFGGKGHRLTIIGAAAGAENTLVQGANIFLHGGVSRVLHKNETVRFVHLNSTQWLEESANTSYLVVDGWTQDNVTANQTNIELTRATGRWRATRAGSVTGLVVTSTLARTAGTLTIKLFKNTGLAGAAGAQLGTITAVLDGTNTSRLSSIQKTGSATFAAGDELFITVTTDSAWTPTTSGIRCALEITT